MFLMFIVYCLFFIIAAFQKQQEEIHLETCCITGQPCSLITALHRLFLTSSQVLNFFDFASLTEMNDEVGEGVHRPVVYGIGTTLL